MEYIRNPMFWIAVVAVAIIVNFAWNFFTKKGKLI